MKKIISAVLASVLAAGSAVCAAAAGGFQVGDVNFDGQVSIKDSTMIQKHCAGYFRFSDAQMKYADSDGNGKVNISDATHIQRRVAGYAQHKVYTDEEAAAAGNKSLANLGVTLLQKTREDSKNTLVSPLSVMYALAMTANGAKGTTLKQMEDTLGIELDGMNKFLKNYQSDVNAPYCNDEKFSIANSIWCNTLYGQLTYNESFKNTVTDNYSAEIKDLPFDNAALNQINGWVKDNTDGMIENILDQINPQSYMYLVNALAFDAEWDEPYDPRYMVREGTFTNYDKSNSDVEYMSSEEFKYITDGTAQGFIKYFKSHNYAFAALVPSGEASLDDYVASLDGEKLVQTLSAVKEQKLEVKLPKFKADYGNDLAEILQDMGITQAFDPESADFSGMISNAPFNPCIGAVIHKTAIDVNEKGTKAAAATAVEIKAGATPEEPIKLNFDRPFLYMLINTKTNTPFFIGTVDKL